MEDQNEVSNLDRVKSHVKKHKVVYITGAACVVAFGVGFALPIKPKSTISMGDSGVTFLNSPVTNHTTNNIVSMGGHMRKIVENTETGEIFRSVTEAAKSAKVNIADMSRHLNGHAEHIGGAVYRIIGLSAD